MKYNKIMFIIFLLLFLSSCAIFDFARFDNVTLRHLVYSKQEVLYIYNHFPKINPDLTEVRLKQALEYEQTKKGNIETIRQFEILLSTFQRHVKNKKWSNFIRKENIKSITNLFNVAIQSERSKNKVFSL